MHFLKIALAGLAALYLAQAPARANDGITPSAIVSQVNDQLAGRGWIAASVEVTGTTRIERNNDLLVIQEFTARARALETFYQRTRTVEPYVFLAPAAQPGDGFDLSGEAITIFEAGATEQRVNLYNLSELSSIGRPRTSFDSPTRTAVVEGTPEADAALAEIAGARAEAAARAEAERLNALYGGEWISLSRCGNIDFEHRFTIEPGTESGRFTGEVSYRPIYPSPPFELGSHTVNARIDTRRDRLVIEPGTWIERPQGNRGVTITLTAEGGEDGAPVELTGESSNMLGIRARGNCTYRLQRPDAWQAEREETLVPVRALIARMQEGVWIDGSQTGPERDGRTDWPVRVRVSTITENYVVATAELQAFHGNSRRVLGIVEYPFAIFLTRGIENAHIDWGTRPRPRGGDMRNLYTRSNFCPALRITLDADTGVVSGSNNDRQGCIDEIRLPLVP